MARAIAIGGVMVILFGLAFAALVQQRHRLSTQEGRIDRQEAKLRAQRRQLSEQERLLAQVVDVQMLQHTSLGALLAHEKSLMGIVRMQARGERTLAGVTPRG